MFSSLDDFRPAWRRGGLRRSWAKPAVGRTVGYQVRFEEAVGPTTRLRFVTEGILTRRLLTDPSLRNVSAVVLDEFHERHLEADLALALLRRLQNTTRRDLRIVIMSATLDSVRLSDYLDNARVLNIPGRVFDVTVMYRGHSAAPLEEQIAGAVQMLTADGSCGHILAFVPGAAEIRRAMRACESVARATGLTVLPLHGDLSPEDQDRAVLPGASGERKLIISTNVAESSVTVEGVTAVIDSGLARVASDSGATGLPTLEIRRISQASATQRTGRAGRTQPGRCVRLYSEEDFRRRPEHDTPEITRRELSQMLLGLRAMSIAASQLEWLDAPPVDSLSRAEELLDRLHANGKNASELARYPLHPRLARLVQESAEVGAAKEGCRVAAHLSSGERAESIDVLDAAHEDSSWKTAQIEKQIRRLVRGQSTESPNSDEPIRIAILAAYPDRVARRRSSNSLDAQLADGTSAVLASHLNFDLFVALSLEDRGSTPLIRTASCVTPEWLLDLFPERIRERNEVVWNRASERVEAVSALLYDELPIEETRSAQPDTEKASELLAAKAIEAGLHRWADPEEVESLVTRAAFAREQGATFVPDLTDADVEAGLRDLAWGLRSFRELEDATRTGVLLQTLKSRMSQQAQRELDELAPERIPLKNRQVKVVYKPGQPPSIASRLQDFFGLTNTPKIARGRVPLVLHLLAPNQRPVQMTTDLAGFWQRLYPEVRRELSRRYPKHSWPEKPV